MRGLKAALVAATGAIATFATTDAAALEFGTPASKQPFRSAQNFALEFRFGDYRPAVDDEPGLRGTPFRDRFGDVMRLYVGIEFDWQMFRIPYLGTIGPGLGVGTVGMSRPAPLVGSNEESADDTSLRIYPFYLSAVLRADALWRNAGLPIVPYAKLGLGYALWSTSKAGNTSEANGVKGEGGTLGTHLALGASLALDVIDRGASRNIDSALGINGSYIFAEYYWLNLNGLLQDSVLYVGTTTWAAGLAFEF